MDTVGWLGDTNTVPRSSTMSERPMEKNAMTPGEPSYAIAPSVLYRRVDEQMVLLDIQSEQYFGLNDVGADIVSRLTREPLERAMAALEEDYEVDPEVLRKDVSNLIDALLAAGLLVRVPTSSRRSEPG